MNDVKGSDLYFDGWYMDRQNADDCLACCVSMGATAIGIVENEQGAYGVLYWSPAVLFSNHVIDGMNAAAMLLQVSR